MLTDKKVQYKVESITENADGTMLIRFTRIMPEGVEWASPSDPSMVIVQKNEHHLSVGQIIDGPIVAQVDDGVVAN
ncbi:MAG: hypothetical protein WAX04_08125 [Oscillospiraceae bacterium]